MIKYVNGHNVSKSINVQGKSHPGAINEDLRVCKTKTTLKN